jgi:hypothetical protein
MSDLAPWLIAFCALAALVMVLFAFGSILLTRFSRRTLLFPILSTMLRSDDGDDVDVEPFLAQDAHATTKEMRAKAEALDFDVALAKYRDDDDPARGKSAHPPPENELVELDPALSDDHPRDSDEQSVEDDPAESLDGE